MSSRPHRTRRRWWGLAVGVGVGVGVGAVAARGVEENIVSVDAATRAVRVFEPREVAMSSGSDVSGHDDDDDDDIDGYYGGYDDESSWRESFWLNEHDYARAGQYDAYDDYVAREVAKLEASLLTSPGAENIDVGELQRALDDIALELRSDLERVARARASQTTWMDSTVGVSNGRGGAQSPTTRAMDGVTVIYNENQGSQSVTGYNTNTQPPPYYPYEPAPRGGGSYEDPYIRYSNDAYIIYDESGTQVLFEPQGEIGRLMQQLTWFSTIFPGNPTAFDDYMRCATLIRPCSVEEVLRKCTYEPRKSWYRERVSRMNAPIDWPYCQPDLDEVYDYCTEIERQTSMCDPRRARERMYVSRAVLFNGGDRPCMRWRTDIFGVRVCVDRSPHK